MTTAALTLDANARVLREAWIAAGVPKLETLTPVEARQLLAGLQRGRVTVDRPVELVRDLACAGPAGPIPLRLYHPRPGTPLPAILFLHGGGWVLGDLEGHDPLCRALANACDAAVLAVDYRLAPEHPYPAAVDDSVGAMGFLIEQSEALGVDPSRLMVAGDSAGGTLATVLALARRQSEEVPLRLVLLLYPALDLAMAGASHALEEDGLAVTGATMRWFREHYLGAEPRELDWRMSPAAATTFRGLPPCHLVSAGIDPLRDEAFEFAFRLAKDGVSVVHDYHAGQMHGFLTASLDSRPARDALNRIALRIRQLCF